MKNVGDYVFNAIYPIIESFNSNELLNDISDPIFSNVHYEIVVENQAVNIFNISLFLINFE